jgi:hypothetical protein
MIEIKISLGMDIDGLLFREYGKIKTGHKFSGFRKRTQQSASKYGPPTESLMHL